VKLHENRDLPVADLRQMANDVGGNEMRVHQRRAQALAVGATLGPLVGLLGAVIGLMTAFKDFGLLGQGDPSQFAGHIALALIPTVAGITVALPSYGLYYLFRSRAGALTEELETELQTVLVRCVLRRAAGAANG
jgi:biopolymer transport protein ExbB